MDLFEGAVTRLSGGFSLEGVLRGLGLDDLLHREEMVAI